MKHSKRYLIQTVFLVMVCSLLNAIGQTSLIESVNTAVVDTNSSYFGNVKFDLRSGATQRPSGTSADVGIDYNVSKHFQLGADTMLSTGGSAIQSAQVDLAYRIAIHNIEFDPLVAIGYDWDSQVMYAGVGLDFRYAIRPESGVETFIRPQLVEDVKNFNRPELWITAGVTKSF